MGWCGGTDFADLAISEAEKLVRAALGSMPGVNDVHPVIDELLRPFVRAIAHQLNEEDWDCVEESEYFERFPQELLDHSDREYEEYLTDQIRWSEAGSEQQLKHVENLKAHRAKMAASDE